MGYLGLDWGNVPSWFSAASFGAAAYAIVRDRQYRKRDQINNVGVWGDFRVDKAKITPVVHFKNASKLPVYISKVKYRMRYCWFDEATIIDGEPKMLSYPRGFDGTLSEITLPPEKEASFEGKPFTAKDRPSIATVTVPSRSLYTGLLITEFTILDNQRRWWTIRPKNGSNAEQYDELMTSMATIDRTPVYKLIFPFWRKPWRGHLRRPRNKRF
ncbi:hypothetical protein [Amycolatopsis sp. cmx-4-68]|uniref:hypothetical protein n=1 Tax=Amycolatopsis sp. cmx-4-68 TaxID=2790938 RepID=UPI00397BECF7